tara:strand:+ start:104 stop:1210 length:1107 start_codon:yes stop_codon:yes gene_type:complete
MKPRVFVSSTYFDLKHVRERIERFIENYGFEPVLFESDNVVFEHNKPLDLSCYNEVKLCHMMILIIGGRYGSIISGDNLTEKKESYDNDYISITRKEFETASKMNIPVFIFIEKNVYAEYHTYNKNKKFFDTQINSSPEKTFSFAHVDDVNVFKFINSVERIALKTFEKIEDIENYLQNQIAGMLYLYLQQLQDNINEERILDSVSELKSISKRMNEMIIAVGKNVIQDNSFENVLFDQNKILIEFYVEQFTDNITFKNNYEISIENAEEIYELSLNTLFNYEKFKEVSLEKDWNRKWELRKNIVLEFQEGMHKIDEKLQVDQFDYFKIYENYFKKVFPLIINQPNLFEYFKSKFSEEIKNKILDLPF